jgi:hypothetical protein
MEAIAQLRGTLTKSHGGSFADVRVVALDLDEDIKPGLQFISQVERRSPSPVFDQISVGGSWLNDEFIRVGWRGRMAASSIPQVLVVARPVDASAYSAKGLVSVGADSVLADVVGATDIVAWVASGARLGAVQKSSGAP